MLNFRTGIFIALLSLAVNAASFASCGAARPSATATQVKKQSPPSQNQKNASVENTGSAEKKKIMTDGVKVLAEGGFSRVADPLLVVARNAETYAALRQDFASSLPELDANFFKSNAVVAAFLGTRRTGGFGVQITKNAGNVVRLAATSPQAGELSAQVISSPFKIASVSINSDADFSVEADEAWMAAMRPYRVTGGEFTVSGGIAGRTEKFNLGGELRALRYGKLATITFRLKSTGGAKSRVLNNILTGIAGDDGKITLAPLDAGSLIDNPRAALTVAGQFTNGEDSLALAFMPLPSTIADGYSGQGNLNAIATQPPPPKRKSVIVDEM